jgi:threonine dehydrogenase-like Zn-dependent dehydrogenase
MVRRPGDCANCKAGRQDYCMDGHFVEAGIRGKDGFMRELFYEDPRFLIKVDRPENAQTCVLSEPTKNIMKILESVTMVSKRQLWDLSGGLKGKGVWIYGTGAEGLLAAAVFTDAGAKVMVVNRRDTTDAERNVVDTMGCGFFNSLTGDWKAAAASVPMDLVIDAVGLPEILELSAMRINRNGLIVLFGTGGQNSASQLQGAKIIELVDKNAAVVGCEDGARQHYEQAVAFIEKNRARYGLDTLITNHCRNDDLTIIESKASGEIKGVIDW